MCGIWGAVNVGDEAAAACAADSIAHRGPDDHGIFSTNEPFPVHLVNTRLAIIDLSQGGHQPMCTPDGRYWIVYNGETYNYQPLRDELLELGHHFASDSDTEVILHAYAEWGEACLSRLRGMFAFAIWDRDDAAIFVARDRLGIKPVYYAQGGTPGSDDAWLAFGSELHTLLDSGVIERRVNPAALHHYLSFYAVPAPYTMLDGVEALPAGHYMTFRDGRLTVKQYWSLPPAEPLDLPDQEVIARLRELLEESIRLRMIADVPVGAFLSGGIDSSAVVALMTRATGERLKTFSVGFGAEGQAIDERSAARVLAEHYGTDHTEVIVTGRDVRDQIGAIILAMDQPTGDGLNTYFVSQATASHVKVALSGLGGDELFAGYPQFSMFERADRARAVWDRLPGVAQQAARSTGTLVDPVNRAMNWLEGSLLDRYERVRVLFNEEAKQALYTAGFAAGLAAPESSLQYLSRYVHPAENGSVAQLTRLELNNYMAHTLLRDTDVMSMAHSLEVRVPLIDHELVEFAARIPAEMKLHNGHGKWVFAEALRDVLPEQVLNRPKRGFEMPVAAWMRGELRDVLEDVYAPESLRRRGLFDVDAARSIYDAFLGGAPYLYAWSLAVLELWMRATIDGESI